MNRLKHLLTFTRPLLLALAALTYTLGTGIARYLGRADSPLRFGLGFGWVLLVLLAMNLLTIYFRPPNEPLIDSKEDETIKARNWLRAAAFQITIGALGVAAVLTILLFVNNISPNAILFGVLILLVALGYALPPLRLIYTGLGEFTLAILFALLIPAFSLSLQIGELHRLLGAVAFPLAALTFAVFLILNFPNFAEDRKYERGTLLIRIGWQRAVPLHHILVLTAYLLFAAMPLFGFPRSLILPVFLIAPFALFQIFWLQRIAQGAPPNWKFLRLLALSMLGLTAYILTLTFWIR